MIDSNPTRGPLISLSRRDFLKNTAALGVCSLAPNAFAATEVLKRRIAKTAYSIPAIGMGTWLTFDVGDSAHARGKRVEILQQFFAMGGQMIDSSPMYGTSQVVLGHCLSTFKKETPTLFSATKVWTPGRVFGIRQMKNSADLWGVPRFDLMQVHNLLDWETHLTTLKQWREEGRVKYIGVTTSHGRRHEKLVSIMENEPIDFVQFTYNILDREAEQQLLPLALERGVSVIVNRPFQGSRLFDKIRDKPVPPWAAEFNCENWAQFFLKFILSHRAVTCAIPATSRLDHMTENMGALRGPLPNPKQRREMVRYYVNL
ncbi:MAG: aldo/keto reductase [Pseudomonadota bacterium]